MAVVGRGVVSIGTRVWARRRGGTWGGGRQLCALGSVSSAGSPSSSSLGSSVGRERGGNLNIESGARCPGCGVTLQSVDPKLPGWYKMPAKIAKAAAAAAGADECEEGIVDGPAEEVAADTNAIVCARCYSLVHYGRVKDADAERLLPAFDLAQQLRRVLRSPKSRTHPPVFLFVVDVADFEGSLPDAAIREVMAASEDAEGDRGGGGGVRVIMVINKCDLLPSQVSLVRVKGWVRQRMRAMGLMDVRNESICMISALSLKGIPELAKTLEAEAGVRGMVYAVGAQNAGKSSVINALCDVSGRAAAVTVAEMPGTTLAPVAVKDLLPRGSVVLDTPGVLHPFQMTSRLPIDETKMLLGRTTLKPRTFRIPEGSSVLAGGLFQIDVLRIGQGKTLYLTLWASSRVTTFMGKTEKASVHRVAESGKMLKPPLNSLEERPELGAFQTFEVEVEGDDWRKSSVDIAAAGIGWVAVGCKGGARLRVGAYEGIGLRRRDALIPDYATVFGRPGFERQGKQTKKASKR